MVPVLVLLTFAALLLLHHFVISKGYLEEKTGWPARLETLPPPAAQGRAPADVFLQPGFTWSRLAESGAMYLGLHPTLLGLVGPSGTLELRRPGEHIERGGALAGIARAGCRLTVPAPVAGRVERVNRRAAGPIRWREIERKGGPWLYRFLPEQSAHEAAWVSGDAALEWTRRRYDRLRAYLQDAVRTAHLGPMMADGGELPVGILGEFGAGVWAGLESRFLSLETTTELGDRPGRGEEGRA